MGSLQLISSVGSQTSQELEMLRSWSVLVFSLVCLEPGQAGLLGAGEGDGSCAAPPFRADTADLAWPSGCPAWASCCTEYGYCHPRSSWEEKLFRDCNGESNGIELPPDTLLAEAEAEAGDSLSAELPLPAETEDTGEDLVVAPPLPVIDNLVTEYDTDYTPPLNGLYQAPGE